MNIHFILTCDVHSPSLVHVCLVLEVEVESFWYNHRLGRITLAQILVLVHSTPILKVKGFKFHKGESYNDHIAYGIDFSCHRHYLGPSHTFDQGP